MLHLAITDSEGLCLNYVKIDPEIKYVDFAVHSWDALDMRKTSGNLMFFIADEHSYYLPEGWDLLGKNTITAYRTFLKDYCYKKVA